MYVFQSRDKTKSSRNDNENENHKGFRYLSLWEDCYSDYSTLNTLYIGVSIGSSLFSRYDQSIATLFAHLELLFTDVNLIFIQQFHIMLSIRRLQIVHEDSSPRPQWDNHNCKANIDQHLENYSPQNQEVEDEESQDFAVAVWHLLDDCYKEGDPIGKAYVGVLCNDNSNFHYARSISYFSERNFFITIAHELGHNFGAMHSFEEGKGTTGGIMDYGDGTLNGEFQFNRKYRYDEICSFLDNNLEKCQAQGSFVKSNSSNLNATCGNGIVEPGEECECTNIGELHPDLTAAVVQAAD